MPFSLRELRYFLAAADHRSATAAATAVNVSQPSISLAVADLEKRLGVQLFVRHHARGLALTPAGTDILREARKLLAQASDLEAMASSLGDELRGRLKIGCLPYLTPRYLPAILAGFTRRHPDIEIDFIEDDQSELVQSLMTGEIEMALTYNLDLPNNVEVDVLYDLPPYVIVSDRHSLASRKRIDMKLLAAEPVILLDLPISRDYYRTVFNILKISPQIRYRSKSVEAVRGFVANGLGYSILNHRSETNLTYDGSRLAALEISQILPSARIAAIIPAGMKLRRIVKTFIDYTKEHFRSNPNVSHARKLAMGSLILP